MKTRPGICNRKKRFATREAAEGVAARASITLRVYKCELCRQYHLTSRTKGMKTPRSELSSTHQATTHSVGQAEMQADMQADRHSGRQAGED